MDFMQEIKELSKKKSPKWKILKESYSEEINEMINLGIPIKEQISLIIKHTSIEKLDSKEYRNIIKKYFSNEQNQIKKVTKKEPEKIVKNENKVVEKPQPKKSALDLLSEDFNLRG